jgi:hypothetical protein
LLRDYSNARVLISPWKYEEEIKTGLIKLGFPEFLIYYLRSNKRISVDEFEAKHLAGYRWAWDFFDEHSRGKITDRINYYLLGTPCAPDSLHRDSYWAFPQLRVSDSEVYIDGGTYTGDTVNEFIDLTGGKYRRIYAFEPDSTNFKIAMENCRDERVSVINKGLYSRETVLRFLNNTGGERVGARFADS